MAPALAEALGHFLLATTLMQAFGHALGHALVETFADPLMNPLADPLMDPLAHPLIGPLAHPLMNPLAHPLLDPLAHPLMDPLGHPLVDALGHPLVDALGHPFVDAFLGNIANMTATANTGELNIVRRIGGSVRCYGSRDLESVGRLRDGGSLSCARQRSDDKRQSDGQHLHW